MKNYKEILKMAVENEVEAHEFYKDAAEKIEDKTLKSTFKELAEEEKKHEMILKSYFDKKQDEMKFDETKDYKVAETVEEQKLSTDMSFKDAIALAMKKEQEAMDMYQQFANASEEEQQKQTFLELVKMEKGHKTRLEDIYTNAAFAEVW
ncbi:ferritin-like domain-containing protein [Tindallia californiensis]|uniref:Rubrerythrin n=1 Tax=Tindallia californiensis TaxID=159292 RepID=A0A1H3K2F5_9FIRM|nr:ferritin family protein [Tindallia californiensis]SDY45945.1 Rubrerythrin [Tindallia californiensis]